MEIVVPTADQYARRLGASESPLGCNQQLGRWGPGGINIFGHVIDIMYIFIYIYRCFIYFMNFPSSMILISPFVMLCCRLYSRYHPSCLGLSWSHYPSCSTLCPPAGCSLRFQRLGHCSYTFLPGNHRCSHQLRHVEAVVKFVGGKKPKMAMSQQTC